MEWIRLIFEVLLAGGFFVTLATLRSIVAKSKAESKHARHDAQQKEVDLVINLQRSNEYLSTKLEELLREIVEVKTQNTNLQISVKNLRTENEQLKRDVAALNVKLKNVTITKTK